MRAVWWSVAALALLAVTSALRTTQVEGAPKSSRRLPAPITSDSPTETSEPPDGKYTIKPRTSRRREDVPLREVRTRTRSKLTDRPNASSEAPKAIGRNERYDSRRTQSRSRSRNVNIEKNATVTNTERNIRNRNRQNVQITTTTSLPEVSSPIIDETKIEVINSNLQDLEKVSPSDDVIQSISRNNQFKRRSSTSSTIQTSDKLVPQRVRGRINTRPIARSLDLDGTTNAIIDPEKEITTARSVDLRNSRKLRYKTRLSETDSNLTGEGLKAQNNVIKSSQNEDNVASQPEMQVSAAGVVENSISQQSTESLPEKTVIKIKKGIRRPISSRGKINFKPSLESAKKPSDEISDDDNYPESFKALIQAKNASTQTSSPRGESLSVKASQKVYKTYTASSQSTNTGPGLNKYTRLRSKLNAEKTESKEEPTKSLSNDTQQLKSSDLRPRGSFTTRSRKPSSFSPSSTSSQTTEKSQYKFSRKFKVTTTESPKLRNSTMSKRTETNALLKKSARSSYYPRKSFQKKNSTTEKSVNAIDQINNTSNVTADSFVAKSVLPRTSYYSRLRNKKNNIRSSTSAPESSTETISNTTENKSGKTADMPLIFTLLKNPTNFDTSSEKMQNIDSEKNEDKDNMFIIAVSSTESQEIRSTEVTNMIEERENSPTFNIISTTPKYHSNFKDFSSPTVPDSKENMISSTIPPVINIQARNNVRKFAKQYNQPENVAVAVQSPKEKSVRKYSEPFSKTTEASTNGISVDSEKSRSRFSSKYRAPHLDKPNYKPTVPTITSSTAWLKFFVTDQLLTKSLEEPKWFEDDDLHDVRTESMSRQTTAPPLTHESSLELAEGEEIDLGPDINAISFTKTRSRLSSADLRLSESLLKSSHIMNVEASHHSPSVTVSIFDALAEILTSTPRTRLSSTTEVSQKQNTKNDVTQIFNGVSNSNVNSVGGSLSQDTLSTSTPISTSAKTVQATDQTTPIVINRLSGGDGLMTTLNIDMGKVGPVNTILPTPTPTPTTPVSARKPFAIRLLYSDTESTIDSFSTTTVPASIQPSTDSTMVYNTVSDLLLSNNNLLSSELTSMLSNNIANIIQNMDESSKSRITLDMAELLKTLIPRAIDGLSTANNDVDSIPSTTPYSLEDIKDTENVNINGKNSDINILSNNILQSGFIEKGVNSTINSSSINDNDDVSKNVNSTSTTLTTLSVPNSQTTAFEITSTPVSNFNSLTSLQIESTTKVSTTMLADLVGTDKKGEVSKITSRSGLSSTDISQDSPRVPFLTNFQAADFNFTETVNTEPPKVIMTAPLTATVDSSSKSDDNTDSNKVSPFQFWVLSKKARVLKMIEDLIRQHNDELATAQPLTDIISQSSNIPLSNRLTKIISNMGLTTETSTVNDDIDMTSTTLSNNLSPLTTSTIIENTVESLGSNVNNVLSSTEKMPTSAAIISSTLPTARLEILDTTKTNSIQTSSMTTTMTSRENLQITTENVFDIFNRNQDQMESVTIDSIDTTTMQDNTETTTDFIRTETTTETNIDTTTQILFESTTSAKNSTNQVPLPVKSQAVSSQSTIPKKDYVIFGILPNNTVVRKDPNDNPLESLTEASPYIVYGVLPNNTVIRKFPNGTRVPRVMQKIDVLPISPWNLKNPYSPIHNNPAIVRPQSNPIRVSSNIVTSTDASNNGTENRLTSDTVNNLQITIPPSALNIKDSGSLGITTATNKPPAEKSTASHVLSLRTTTMLPSVDEILLNSISSAAKEEMVIPSMTSSTSEPRILTLDIDPETKEIRTEKPGDGNGSAVFKFIPIDEVTVAPQNTNVLKLASTKSPLLNTEKLDIITPSAITPVNTDTPQIQTRLKVSDITSSQPESSTSFTTVTSTESVATTEPFPTATFATPLSESTTVLPSTTLAQTSTTSTTTPSTTTTTTTIPTTTTSTTTPSTTTTTTTLSTTTTTTTTTPSTTTTTTTTTTPSTTTTTSSTTTTTPQPTTTTQAVKTEIPIVRTTTLLTTTSSPTVSFEDEKKFQQDAQFLQELLQGTVTRNPKNLDIILNTFTTTILPPTTTTVSRTVQRLDEAKLLQALLGATGQNSNTLSNPNYGNNVKVTNRIQTTTTRSIEDDIRQFEEDTKLLKALLQATGQNPANFNIPTLNIPRTTTPIPTTTTTTTTTTPKPTTTTSRTTTIQSINEDIRKLQEDTKLLQALLQATGKNKESLNIPLISGVTSNVRIASNPLTTSLGSNPTTPVNVRPVYKSRTTTPIIPTFTFTPRNIFSTFQTSSNTENFGISTTVTPFNQERRAPTTVANFESSTILGGRRAPLSRITTTEMPSTSTFSVEEDLAFLNNLKTVLKTNANKDDPEGALANRIIALAVERSLNEIQSTQPESERTGKKISNNVINNLIPTTTFTTTTTTSTTTTARPTTTTARPTTTTTRPTTTTTARPTTTTRPTTTIKADTPSLEDDIKQFQEDTKLLQALLQATGQDPSKFNIPTLPPLKTNTKGAQEVTTLRNKLPITGQTSDEALKKLLQNQQKSKPPVMVSQPTQAPMSLSTEFGKSNDALLAALLKEQGFGPTTASSLDEQLRLSALLNQVVVTPKTRRTTTPPPPPPPPRRPILDGIAWLWQQWRETAPGPTPRPSRKPTPSAGPAVASSAATSNRVNWFGSGPFVGNADEQPTSNRVPLDPPRAVTSEQTPGRGQLVSAAINVTRAFSQFLGAAIQGAAQTVQNVIRAGQRAATDVYVSGSGGSG